MFKYFVLIVLITMYGCGNTSSTPSVCDNKCSQEGVLSCDRKNILECQKDANGCLNNVIISGCNEDEACMYGSCFSTTCDNQTECQENQKECLSDNKYKICGNFDSDICLEWSNERTCPENSICENGECIQLSICQIENPTCGRNSHCEDVDGVATCVCDENWWGENCDYLCQLSNDGIEICDGKDNDCDGVVDIGNLGASCFDGLGECRRDGVFVCGENGDIICSVQADLTQKTDEICDGKDNDCDGEIDENVIITYYQDSDDDNYGNLNVTTQACSKPDGYVLNSSDCDDNDNSRFPENPEICDGKDNNCDNQIDNGLVGELTTEQRGVCLNARKTCQGSSGWVDVYDGVVSHYEDVTERSCDGRDNNCDGEIDNGLVGELTTEQRGVCLNARKTCQGNLGWVDVYEGVVSNYENSSETSCDGLDNDCDGEIDENLKTVYYQDSDSDNYGKTDVTTLACSKPDGYAVVGNDCDDYDNKRFPENPEICDGKDNNCDNQIDNGLVGELTTNQKGVCLNARKTCQGSSGWVDLYVGVVANYEDGSETSCDNLDNDCDNFIDENLKTTYYLDSDSDNYGDLDTTTQACSKPDGYVENGNDCDDDDNQKFPNNPEVCDSKDNDCNSQIDDGNIITLCRNTEDVDACLPVSGGNECKPIFNSIDSIVAGSEHSCALKNDGSVYCWGRNDKGQIGDNTTTKKEKPAFITFSDQDVVMDKISANNKTTCSIDSDSDVWCWGFNNTGQLGDRTTTDKLIPVKTQIFSNPNYYDLSGVEDIANGLEHTCVLRRQNETSAISVSCWGNMSYGALDNYTTTNQLYVVDYWAGSAKYCTDFNCYTKAEIKYLQKIVAGEKHTCVLRLDDPSVDGDQEGEVICWGDNSKGQVGVINSSGTEIANFNYWGRVVKLQNGNSLIAKDIIAGKEFTCAITDSEQLYCWGDNSLKQIDNTTNTEYIIPTLIDKPHVLYVAAKNGQHSMGTTTTKTTILWGKNNRKQVADTNNNPENNTTENVESSDGALGIEFSCLLNVYDQNINYIQCKGRNNNGQLGRGNSTDSPILSPVLE
ncbi:hypothetical protein JXR93_09310 [bacterium]|nr:hypothetical protein [bacterium]